MNAAKGIPMVPPRGPRVAAGKDLAESGGPPEAGSPESPPTPTVDSQALLQGRGSVAISHRGVVYRLHATRTGKLILTK